MISSMASKMASLLPWTLGKRDGSLAHLALVFVAAQLSMPVHAASLAPLMLTHVANDLRGIVLCTVNQL